MYATPSTDTAVMNAPSEKIGSASGIYKMASSLGSSFGVAISATIYGTNSLVSSIEIAASAGIITNVVFAVLALISVIITVPKGEGTKRKLSPREGLTDQTLKPMKG